MYNLVFLSYLFARNSHDLMSSIGPTIIIYLELVLRYTSLALMICQYVCQVLFTRFAVIRAANDHRQPTFLKTVAIVLKELLEAFVSFLLFLVFTKSNKSSLLTIMETLKNAPMFLPALAYTVKNFLIFVVRFCSKPASSKYISSTTLFCKM